MDPVAEVSPRSERDRYRSPLLTRYASAEMSRIFGERSTVLLWRRIWLALAESQRELGIAIREDQLAALRAGLEAVDFERALAHERELRHDVMAHIHAFADAAPEARPILHLGATSADVTDNANLIQLRDALDLVRRRLVEVIRALAGFARTHGAQPALGYTHFQAAQPTTVGKRACLWLQDFLLDLTEVESRLEGLRLKGLKGATGTQASYLALFAGDARKVEELERRFCARLGFDRVYPVTGQTYPRKVDALVLGALGGIGESAAKLSTDLRLLQGLQEIAEPAGERQVGSSAMPYKRNPVRAERIGGLARYLMVTVQNADWTAAGQWLERSLDDSANRRLAIPEAFLATDAVLIIVREVVGGLEVRPAVIEERLRAQLPFLASEVLLAEGVRRGGDRQRLHETLRRAAREAASGEDFLARLAGDPDVPLDHAGLQALLAPAALVGLAAEQVEAFLTGEVEPVLAARAGLAAPPAEVRV